LNRLLHKQFILLDNRNRTQKWDESGEEEAVKKRNRRTQKFQKPIEGATLTEILAKRNMKPEVRKAQREQAIRALKEKNRAAKAKKPAVAGSAGGKKAADKTKKPIPKVGKPMPKGKGAKTGGQGGRR